MLDHAGTGTLLVPCRWGSKEAPAPVVTAETLAIPGPKALFPVCLTTEQWCTPESFYAFYSPVPVESVLSASV